MTLDTALGWRVPGIGQGVAAGEEMVVLETKSRTWPASMLGPRLTRAYGALSGAVLVMSACAPVSGDPVPAATSVYDANLLHDLHVELDTGDFVEMIETYQTSGDKEWVAATVTIDGARFEDVGLRLKGSSSLRAVDTDADPAELPWLLRLDEYVEGQDLDGYSEFVVRSNTSQTSLNEAVALDLLEAAGLASEQAFATSFSVNGSDEVLRLVVQHLDDTWDAENFDTDGILYKAESGGDYSYRGEDPASYDDIFDQETATDTENLEPLIDFLEFVNNAGDAELADGLPARLDIEAFASYLAFQELVENLDDIDGPGNNSYLRWEEESGQFTVVAWDHNLAFGGIVGARGSRAPGGRPGAGGPTADGELPDDMPSPDTRGRAGDLVPPGGLAPPGSLAPPEGGGFPDGSNILVERFLGNEEFAALYDAAVVHLRASLFDSGLAEDVLTQWSTLLTTEAAALVDPDTVAREAAAIRAVVERGAAD